MCGIAGFVGHPDPQLLRAMVGALRHRGPDGIGYSENGGAIALGAAHLAIVDPEHGSQPMTDPTGRVRLVFNGEIYNHGELRDELAAQGHRFATRTDTEVVLQLYLAEGMASLARLRGMFAIAIADGDTLFLARDRLGIKPLYYALDSRGERFLFASEMKAILRAPDLHPSLDLEAVADQVVLGYVTGSRTHLTGIESCLPGHWMRVVRDERGLSVETNEYYRLELEPDVAITLDAAEEKLGALVASTVASHRAADVEIGLVLSGGLDSSLLAFELRDGTAGEPVPAYSVADAEDHPDLRAAASISDLAGCVHHRHVADYDEYLRAVPRVVLAEEQPTSLFATGFHLLCARVGERLKVVLCGEGADELFGGYQEFLEAPAVMRGVRGRLRRAEELGLRPSATAQAIAEAAADIVDGNASLAWSFDVQLRSQLVRRHLEIVDKHAMAAGVECRVPYVDHVLVELANRLPYRFKVEPELRITKYVLKRVALARHGTAIAGPVLRPKLGFPASTERHLKRFGGLCDELLPRRYVARHELGRCFPDPVRLALLDLFVELFVVGRGASDVVPDIAEFLRSRP